MNPLGIYFGPKLITFVETKGRRVVNTAELPQTVIGASDLDDKLPADMRIVETVGFFKSELKKNNIEAKEATLCLPGQDVFVRSFEMPAMDPEELQSAINFEAEKYIPFKAEHLVSDYQIRYEKQSRTNLVLFMGIKKEVLDRYIAILTQLNIKVAAIEYAGFSLLRSMPVSGVNMKGVTAVLGADLSGDEEINFMVLENGFPLFSRDITLMSGPGGGAADLELPAAAINKAPEQDIKANTEKLKTEIRVSLDYYERKFPTKTIKKIYLLSKPECRPDIELFAKEVGFEFQFIDLRRSIGGAFPYSLGIVKSYTASLFRSLKTPVHLNLVSVREKQRQAKEQASFQLKPESIMEGLSVDFKMVGLGALICAGAVGLGIYRAAPVQKEINAAISARPQVENVNLAATYDELTALNREYLVKLETLNKLIKNQLYLTEPLNIIPAAIPKGVWLTNFSFDNRGEGSESTLILEGVSYLGDNNKEFSSVYQMLTNLTNNPEFIKYFTVVSVSSISRGQLFSLPVTNFSISCKTYGERE